MNGLRDQLIALYSGGPVKQVHAGEAYQKLCRDNEGDRTFNAEREPIERMRSEVDRLLQDTASYRVQVHSALRRLRRLETEEEKQLFRTLVLNSYAAKWSVAARQYFEDTSRFLITAKDYFLSFTSRNPNHPNQNDINQSHRHFIRDSLGSEIYDTADLSKRNLVAESVYYHLQNLNLSGFFYPLHERDNQVVETKLKDNCDGALAFVQLIQTAIFRNVPPARNWCFYEYDLALKPDPARVLFVSIEDGIRKDGVPARFDDWYQHYTRKDPLKLKETRKRSQQVIDENRAEIRKKLCEQIDEVIERIYQAIPN